MAVAVRSSTTAEERTDASFAGQQETFLNTAGETALPNACDDSFALECRAIRRLRAETGFTNVIVTIPFCRSSHGADRVRKAMAANGLRRGDKRLEVSVMCEIPPNGILVEEYARRFAGFSIGSGDLTQLMPGVDRDREAFAPLFRERDPAVTWMIRTVIERAPRVG